jgi:antitoxin MazE
MKTSIRKMGNSLGILIPKPFLAQTGLDIGEVDIQVEGDAIVIRKPARKSRAGWAHASALVAAGADAEVIQWPLIPKSSDTEFTW